MTQELKHVKQEIELMYQLIQNNASHYEILGVERDIETSKVTAQFRKLAKKWHIDRFSKFDLGKDRERVQLIFAQINNAQRILSNNDLRSEYDQELDAVDSGNVEDMINADSLFLRGKNTLNRGGYKGAHDMFKEAHALNPNDIDIQAYMHYTQALMLNRNESGRFNNTQEAESLYNVLKEIEDSREEEFDWLLTQLGELSKGLGKEKEAISRFRRALLINENNHNAKRQLRILEMRREKEANKGFFSKLMDKFKS